MYGHALVASVIANVNRDSRRRSKPYTPDDFLPPAKESSVKQSRLPEQTPEQMLAVCQALFGDVAGARLALPAPVDVSEHVGTR